MLKFAHSFEENQEFGDLSVDLLDNPAGATIRFKTDDSGIWVAANSEEFRYLACIFAEFSMRKLESDYHFHRSDWLEGADTKKEVSVGRLDG